MPNLAPQQNAPNPRSRGPQIVAANPSIRSYAEIGVLDGDTALRVAQVLEPGSELHLFDFDDVLDKVRAKFDEVACDRRIAVAYWGNSRQLRDSYNWTLLRLLKLKGTPGCPAFDYVHLDGAHSYDVDALTFFLADKLLNPDGYFEFDDYSWTFENSATMNSKVYPVVKDWYTDEQLRTPHVKLIVDRLVETSGYERIEQGRLYRKPPHA